MDVSLVKQIPWAWAFAARQRENLAEGQGSTLTDPFDTPKLCRSQPGVSGQSSLQLDSDEQPLVSVLRLRGGFSSEMAEDGDPDEVV